MRTAGYVFVGFDVLCVGMSETGDHGKRPAPTRSWQELSDNYRQVLANTLIGILVGTNEPWDWFDDTAPEIPIDLTYLGLVEGVVYSETPDGRLYLEPGPGTLTSEGYRVAQEELRRRLGLSPSTRGRVFVSYVREDSAQVDALCSRLQAAGIVPWRDTDSLLPGDEWKVAIRRAINSGTAFVACFSPASEAKPSTYMREELILALEQFRQRELDSGWFLPVKLGPCDVPDYSIGSGRTLNDLQFVDLHRDFERGLRRLLVAIDRLMLDAGS